MFSRIFIDDSFASEHNTHPKLLPMQQLKQVLYTLCREYVNKGIAAAEQAIADARTAADEDDKSSAGDKFETAREMMQQEIDLNAAHVNEMLKLRVTLDTINPEHHSDTVQPGSLVRTSQGDYYIAISIGKLMANGSPCYAISAATPLGAILMGHRAGDKLSFNGKDFVIEAVH